MFAHHAHPAAGSQYHSDDAGCGHEAARDSGTCVSPEALSRSAWLKRISESCRTKQKHRSHFPAGDTNSRASASISPITVLTFRLFSNTIWTSPRNTIADRSNADSSSALRHLRRASCARITDLSCASKCARRSIKPSASRSSRSSICVERFAICALPA
jgi:hypothetical protein